MIISVIFDLGSVNLFLSKIRCPLVLCLGRPRLDEQQYDGHHHHCVHHLNTFVSSRSPSLRIDLGLPLSVSQGWPLSREDVRVETPPSLQVAQANSCISAHLFQGEVKLGRVPNLKEITFL